MSLSKGITHVQLVIKIEEFGGKMDESNISRIESGRTNPTVFTLFRIAEALVDRTGLGLDWRLDAAKDVMDMDAIRNEEDTADDGFDNVIKFWSKFVKILVWIRQLQENILILLRNNDLHS